MNLTESLIKLRNMKSKCHLWSGHWASAEKAKLNKALSLASFLHHDRCCGDTREREMCRMVGLCGSDCVLSSAFVSPISSGTAGCPAGEEGCRDSACPLLAWGELPIRMAEVVDTTGAKAFDLETSEGVASGLPTSRSTQATFPPTAGCA